MLFCRSMQRGWMRPIAAAALALALVWLLAPARALSGREGAALLVESALVAAAFTMDAQALRRALFAAAASSALVASVLAPSLWPALAALLLESTAMAPLAGVARSRCRESALATALGVGAAGLLLGGLAVAGGVDSRHAIVGALALGWPGPWRASLAILALALGAWTILRLFVAEEEKATRAPAWAFAGAAAVVLALRLVWIGSFASLPTDVLVWSEPPFLLDLLKLRTGHLLYGPMAAVNSYPYSPLPQLLHHALLAPLGLDLSLFANRALVLLWELGTAFLLFWALRPRVERALGRGWLSWSTPAVLALVAAGSSFLAPYIHPDHALMVCFAVALALMLREDRVPRRLFVGLLLVVPALATAFKLTGAGIGLGLVLVMLSERRWRDIAWLGLAAVIALSVIPLFNSTLGDYWGWGIRLFASQRIRWYRLWSVPSEAASRLALIAAGVFALCRWRLPASQELALARRSAWLTAGFALVSLPGYLKVGGRENDLMPLAIGASVVLLLSVLALVRRTGIVAAVPGAVLGACLVLVPPEPPCSRSFRAHMVRTEHELEALVRSETAAGHRTLLYTSTLAWIRAGRRDVPLDRAQSAIEMYTAGRPELSAHFKRLDRYYDSVIAIGAAFAHGARWGSGFSTSLRRHLSAHYSIVLPPGGAMPGAPSTVFLFRRVHGTGR